MIAQRVSGGRAPRWRRGAPGDERSKRRQSDGGADPRWRFARPGLRGAGAATHGRQPPEQGYGTNPDDAFERIPASLYEAALVDEACGFVGSALVVGEGCRPH